MNTKPNRDLVAIIANTFINSKLTIVIVIISILLGLFSVLFIAKEEEPQILVPMIDIATNVPGLTAKEVEREVTEVIERAMKGINRVEYIYSQSSNHFSLVTVRFKVNSSLEDSLLAIHHKLMDLKGKLSEHAEQSKVESFSIEDVPFLMLTFSSPKRSGYELRQLIAPIARELSYTPDLNKISLLGGQKRAINIIIDEQKLVNKGVSILAVANAIKENDLILPAGENLGSDKLFNIEVGGRYKNIADIKNVAIGYYAGKVVKIEDIANVIDGPEELNKISTIYDKSAEQNAVSLAFSKRKGVNAVLLAKELLSRTQVAKKSLPADVQLTIMRDYGETAKEKADELIKHLFIATILVSILIALFMGIRAATIVAIAIPVTLALTLAAFYFLGYTLNRVTLFALIFAIGILVDDAIVVVENIERHFSAKETENLAKLAIYAVSEIGGATILATFAVICAILPMSFVQGLMGPYMKPIPVGSSFAMIFSLLVAFIITPWAAIRLLKKPHIQAATANQKELAKLDQIYSKIIHILLDSKKSATKFLLFVVLLFMLSCSLIYFKFIKVKMLPFDNKNEFQVLLDYPVSTSLEKNHELSKELAKRIIQNNANVLKVQIFSGEPAPFSFSGMVKHTFLRTADYMSDFQVLLTNKDKRHQSSHEIIAELRPIVQQFATEYNVVAKILEIPPGPPVLGTMVAEVYAKTQTARDELASDIYNLFKTEPSFVDLDWSLRKTRQQKIYEYNYQDGGLFGANAAVVANVGKLLFSNTKLATLTDVSLPEEIAINLAFTKSIRSNHEPFKDLKIQLPQAGSVEVNLLLNTPKIVDNEVINHKNLIPLNYITSELSGDEEAPIYGIMKLAKKMQQYSTFFMSIPANLAKPIIKWDGEMFITLEVFRDLGVAFIFAIIGIYLLILTKFKSFLVPIVIMTPIPISLIGILFGHAITATYFTATSMIGFMAGAGIIVRNSIILIDFIEHQMQNGLPLKDAVIISGILRFRPMLLTAAAVIFGSLVMLKDPIFGGFAVSLIFGEITATLLSRFTIPIIYYYGVGTMRERIYRLA